MFYCKHVTHLLCLIILQKVTDSALDGRWVMQPLIWLACGFGKRKLSLQLQPGIGLSSCVSKVKLELTHVRVASHKRRDFGRTVARAKPKHGGFGHGGLYKQLKLRQIHNFTKCKVATFITAMNSFDYMVHFGHQQKIFYNYFFIVILIKMYFTSILTLN